jgi:hypothetical protein
MDGVPSLPGLVVRQVPFPRHCRAGFSHFVAMRLDRFRLKLSVGGSDT